MDPMQTTEPARPRPPWRLIVPLTVLGAAVLVAFTVHLSGYFIYTPGPVRNVEKLVSIRGARTYPSDGELALTTVSFRTDPTLAELAVAYLDPHQSIVSAQTVPGGSDLRRLQREGRIEMRDSKRAAEEVALRALGYPGATGAGAKVVEVLRDSPASGVLHQGDVIVGLQHHKVRTQCDLERAMSGVRPGQRVSITVRSGHHRRTVSVTTTHNPDDPHKALIGILMTTADYRFDPGVRIRIHTGRIGGPSAGTMMALAIYDLMTPGDLTKGHRIAGTGTIDPCDGAVGPIGGIQEKVAAAHAQGADLFLAPVQDAAAARKVADGLPIRPVRSFSDALRVLRSLPRESPPGS